MQIEIRNANLGYVPQVITIHVEDQCERDEIVEGCNHLLKFSQNDSTNVLLSAIRRVLLEKS